MSQNELLRLASEWADRCPGANLPAAYNREHTRTIRLAGEQAVLQANSQPDVTGLTISDKTDATALLTATVIEGFDNGAPSIATVTARPQPSVDFSALEHANASLYTVGSLLRSDPDPLVQRLGSVTQRCADLPTEPVAKTAYTESMVASVARSGDPLVNEVRQAIEGFTAEPTREEIEMNPVYAWGEYGTEPFIMTITQTEVTEKSTAPPDPDAKPVVRDYKEISLHVETPMTFFSADVTGPGAEVTAQGNMRPTPVYPQLLDPSIPLTEETLKAADNHPGTAGPHIEYPTANATKIAEDFLKSVTGVTTDRRHLFGQ